MLYGTVTTNTILYLIPDPFINATGSFKIENKCCCDVINDNLMCGVQPNKTLYNTCVPYTFLDYATSSYSGLCGADDQYHCANTADAVDANGDCGTSCDLSNPCTTSYECSSTQNGICQYPCGMGCNNGFCR